MCAYFIHEQKYIFFQKQDFVFVFNVYQLKKTFDLDANEIESPKKLVVNSAEVLGRGFEHIVSGFLH